MKNEILLLDSPLKETIWGGDYFKNVLKLTTLNKTYGEFWSLSGYETSPSIIKNGDYKGYTLDKLYQEHRELFANSKSKTFPILIKIISTKDKLSVQVHPDDEYAKYENDLGKTESWLMLDCKEESSIVYGNKAKNKEEIKKYIDNNDFESFLSYHKVKKGMFVPVNAGTIHALGKDLVLLEVQQSSNLTYRLYDYNRLGKDGKPRELHLTKALDVIKVPDELKINDKNYLDGDSYLLWDNEYFLINLISFKNKLTIKNEYNEIEKTNDYYLVTLIEGKLQYLENEIKVGESFIVTSMCNNIDLIGSGKVVITKSKY